SLALRFAQGPSIWPTGGLAQGPGQASAQPSAVALVGHALSPVPERLLVAGIALLFGLVTAALELPNWDLLLRFLQQVTYGENDPAFGRDLGFYLFSLPVYVALVNWLLLLLFFSTAIAAFVYATHGDIVLGPLRVSPAALSHGSVLLGLFF